MKFNYGTIVKPYPPREKAVNLPARRTVEEQPLPVDPFLMRVERHFQTVIIACKTPGRKPVGQGNMERYLIELVQYPVNKKAVLGSL